VKLLITGATGFIGHALIFKLLTHGNCQISVSVRKLVSYFPTIVKQYKFDEIYSSTNWDHSLQGIDCIIHTAARVHVMSDNTCNPLNEFRKINTAGTLNLAKQAADSGVKRFIYLSSIKVNGEKTNLGSPFTADDIFIPTDPYALSKYEAEQGLKRLSENSQMEVVIVRPPLVYGPGVKANFFNMMKWLYKGIPLPFGLIYNHRSLVSLDNLVDLIICCIKHPAAKNQIFLVSDNEDLSTSELLKRVSFYLGKKSHLIPISQKLLAFCLSVIGKKNLAERLCGSLQVDMSKTTRLLNWSPPNTVNNELKKTAQHFLEHSCDD